MPRIIIHRPRDTNQWYVFRVGENWSGHWFTDKEAARGYRRWWQYLMRMGYKHRPGWKSTPVRYDPNSDYDF